VLVVVNLDPFNAHHDSLLLDLGALGLPWYSAIEAHDEITGATYVWYGANPFIRLDPAVEPAHVLNLRAL
jgi:starch synthase (maltosyl-transferring)